MIHLYEIVADLLEYPDDDWGRRLDLGKRQIGATDGLAPDFPAFYGKVAELSLAELQELYTRTFDLNPVCALEVGYHLFGEDYRRGLLLAYLRETESAYELGQDGQLPDYLPVLLRLLVRLDDAELRASLISDCLIPALNKMTAALAQTANPYGDLLRAVNRALKAEAPEREPARLPEGWERAASMPALYRISSRAALK